MTAVINELALPGVLEIVPSVRADDRGYFVETFNRESFDTGEPRVDWVQDNQSLSRRIHTLRGLHFQAAPFEQAKLVRVVKGRIFDVAVDIRPHSPTFRQSIARELTAERFNQLFIPAGFAHGFLTLEEETIVAYKVSAAYSRDHDRAIRWDDPDLAIDWPLQGETPVLSRKDSEAPSLSALLTTLSPEGEPR